MEQKDYLERLLNGTDVEWKPIGAMCNTLRGTRLTKRDLTSDFSCGLYPVFHGGVEPIGYYQESNRRANSTMIINVGASAGTVGYCDHAFWSSDGCYCFSHNNDLSQRFLFYYLQSIESTIKSNVRKAGIPTLDKKYIDKILIPVPQLSIQEEIVEILDKFTTLEAELEAELEARRKQYEYYRNKLLDFSVLNRGGQLLNNVIFMTLGELGVFTRGSGLQKKDFVPSGIGCIHYGQIYTYYGTFTNSTISFVSPEFANRSRRAKRGDLIIATTSENDEDVCKAVAWLGEEEIAVSSDACVFSHSINPKYVAYFFQSDHFQMQKKKYITGTKVRRVNANDLTKIFIPVPPIEEQERIVSILDEFDTLTTSVNEGLPKEISLRRKQYEYYRNQLLSFTKHQ